MGLPCGNREEGKTVIAAAAREVYEEVGFVVTVQGDETVFCIIPDDKLRENKHEYCWTFVVTLNQNANEIIIAESNVSDDGIPEGFGIWVSPQDFVASSNSAFVDYNTRLLQYAGLI